MSLFTPFLLVRNFALEPRVCHFGHSEDTLLRYNMMMICWWAELKWLFVCLLPCFLFLQSRRDLNLYYQTDKAKKVAWFTPSQVYIKFVVLRVVGWVFDDFDLGTATWRVIICQFSPTLWPCVVLLGLVPWIPTTGTTRWFSSSILFAFPFFQSPLSFKLFGF